MTRIRVLLVDDQPAVRHGLRLRIGAEADIDVVGEAGDGATALARVRELEPDVVVMDVTMPGIDGIEATRKLREIVPDSPVVMLSLHDDVTTRNRAADVGAIAFVSKHEADSLLLEAIRDAALSSSG